MTLSQLQVAKLSEKNPTISFSHEEKLAPFTTVHIGGPAELFCTVRTADELQHLIVSCQELEIPYSLLGWGANTLIADRGIRGLVVRNQSTHWQQIPDLELRELLQGVSVRNISQQSSTETSSKGRSPESTRYQTLHKGSSFEALDYDESDRQPVAVLVESGAALPVLLQQLLAKGITGLQSFAKIPSTLGGAIVNNIHGGSHFLAEYLEAVEVLTNRGEVIWLSPQECDFQYDYSRFHHSHEVILRAVLRLRLGDTQRAQQTVAAWAKQKSHQPQRSLGCVFQNISPDDQHRLHLDTPSAGYFIDKILGLKGFQIGQAKISPNHAAFIENLGEATAADYLQIIRHVTNKAKSDFQLTLKTEIFFQGFAPKELSGIH